MKESFAEALPYIRIIIFIFGVLIMPISWYYTTVPTFDRWAWAIFVISIYYAAFELSKMGRNILAIVAFLIGLAGAYWI